MDFWLCIGSNLPKEELRKLLYNMMCEVLFVELIDYEAEVWDWSDTQRVRIGCTYFSMSINLEDEDDYIERYRKANFEAYGVDTNVFISIQFISRTFDIGWLKMLEVIGKLLRLNDKDLVVEDDTSYPLIKRIKGGVLINTHLDEYEANYLTKENLELLNYPYLEDDFFKDRSL
ncbi:hypothetical protein SAMN04487969_1274 [Paenibacillus algorifonticola]|uniref:Uncharacterized protein n=1 Tax=Paenibacillus algorifonticola TaxID=684063 RepID=A0A1I2HTY4_9BACL|nr:hypothetical protein [Paenibacillus algorifonticola]SFF33349.1 hypothetical protein SAMN04487969_1274 [Paenibacillus algorifonticola]